MQESQRFDSKFVLFFCSSKNVLDHEPGRILVRKSAMFRTKILRVRATSSFLEPCGLVSGGRRLLTLTARRRLSALAKSAFFRRPAAVAAAVAAVTAAAAAAHAASLVGSAFAAASVVCKLSEALGRLQ